MKIKKIKHLNMFDENNYLSEVPKYVLSERVTTARWRWWKLSSLKSKLIRGKCEKQAKKECEEEFVKEFAEWKYMNEDPKETYEQNDQRGSQQTKKG